MLDVMLLLGLPIGLVGHPLGLVGNGLSHDTLLLGLLPLGLGSGTRVLCFRRLLRLNLRGGVGRLYFLRVDIKGVVVAAIAVEHVHGALGAPLKQPMRFMLPPPPSTDS
jgi:hypothetical protein